MGELIELPELKRLKKTVRSFRQKLTDLLAEYDELRYITCENIETDYLLEFGVLEYRIYDLYCHYSRLRRKRELIQARLNREETIDQNEVEAQLDQEFADYKKNLEEKLSQINRAFALDSLDRLEGEDLKEFKDLYRQIVKKLHPDLNLNQTEEEQKLFLHAVEAYQNGDLRRMRMIYQMVMGDSDEELSDQSSSVLVKEKLRLERSIDQVLSAIEHIKATYPYNLRPYLLDQKLNKEKHEELNEILSAYQEAIRTQEEVIKTLLEA